MNLPRRRTIPDSADFDAIRAGFGWTLPAKFNIARAICDDWAAATPDRVAVVRVGADLRQTPITCAALRDRADRLANALVGLGLGVGDRVAVLLPQAPEVLVTHIAAWKMGAISVPLFTLFGEDALEYRLRDSGASAIVTDAANLPKIAAIRDRLPALRHVVSVDGPGDGALGFEPLLSRAAAGFATLDCDAATPAIIIYTSGTTGPPKGALHAHRFLLGHCPAVELQHEFFPKTGDIGWTPADWAWIGGLMNIAVACLYYGVPVVAHRMAKFDADRAYRLIADTGARNLFLPPTALKLMRGAKAQGGVNIRTVMSGGESLGAEMLEWGRAELGLKINETYGQTECNLVLTSVAGIGVQKAGAIGKAVPGLEVAIIDAAGTVVPAGTAGEIAVAKGAPQMLLNYWNLPEKSAAKYAGRWMRTGDLGVMDDEGYVTFASRDDDVITSAGYRIGPTEIENCLTSHADVVMAAAVGVPDAVRTEVIKAFVVLRDGATWSEALEAELIARVKARVSPHCAPRWVEPIAAMPMTATGKIMRRELRKGA